MDTVLDDLALMVRRCNRAAATLEKNPLPAQIRAIEDAIRSLAQCHSGSWIGYHANVYYAHFRQPPGDEPFSVEWGLKERVWDNTYLNWRQYSFEDVLREIKKRSGLSDLDVATMAAKEIDRIVRPIHEELLTTLDAMMVEAKNDQVLNDLRREVAEHRSHISGNEYADSVRPGQFRGNFVSRDSEAVMQGLKVPPHIQIEAAINEELSYATGAKRLATLANRARMYIEKRMKMKGKSVAKTEGKVFIGHGKSPRWRELKDFLEDKLELKVDEYNREATAGMSRKERLEQMLEEAVFAFLVMTGEDEYADGSTHARENVVHEVGLFQGRLGFMKAIVLLESGCIEFSNIHGLDQIRFPKGSILAKSEEIRDVLKREGIVK